MCNDIAECCKTLKLSHNIVENCKNITAITHEDFLLQLLKMELNHRAYSRYNRLIKKAGFLSMKSFSGYDFNEVKLPEDLAPNDLKSCNFISQKQNIIMYGNVETGKTHLATTIGIEACKLGLNVGFYRTAALVNQLTDARKEGRLNLLLKKIPTQIYSFAMNGGMCS